MGQINSAVKASLAGVEIAEQKIAAFQYATGNLRNERSRDHAVEDAIRTIYGALYAECMEAYRKVFMWGCVVPDNARAEAKKLALKKFLSDHMSIMQYLHPEGAYPSGWATSEEKKFREEIKRLEKD